MVDYGSVTSTRDKLFSANPRRTFEALCLEYPDTLVFLRLVAARRATKRYTDLYNLLSALLNPPVTYQSRSFIETEQKPSLRTLYGILEDLPWEDTLKSSLLPLIKQARRSWYQQFTAYDEQDTAAAYMVGVKRVRDAVDPMLPRYKGPLVVLGGDPATIESSPGPWKVSSSTLGFKVEDTLYEFDIPQNRKARIDSLTTFDPSDTIDIHDDTVAELVASPGPYSFIYFDGTVNLTTSGSTITADSPIFSNTKIGDSILIGTVYYIILTIPSSYQITVGGSPPGPFTSARLLRPKVINIVYNGVSYTIDPADEAGVAYGYATEINSLVGSPIAEDDSGTLILRGVAHGDTLEIGSDSPFYDRFGFTESSSSGKPSNRQFSVDTGTVTYVGEVAVGTYSPLELADEMGYAIPTLTFAAVTDESTGSPRYRIRIQNPTESPLATVRWVAGEGFPLEFQNGAGMWAWVYYEDLPLEFRNPSTGFSVSYEKRLLGTFSVSNSAYAGPDGTLYVPAVGVRHAVGGALDYALPTFDVYQAKVFEEFIRITSLDAGPNSKIEIITEAVGLSGSSVGATNTIAGMQEGDVAIWSERSVVEDGVLVPSIPNGTVGIIRLVSAALAALETFVYIEPPGETFHDACSKVHGGKKGYERDRIRNYMNKIPHSQSLTNVEDQLGLRFLEELEERGYDAVLELIYAGNLEGAYAALVSGKVKVSDSIRASAIELLSAVTQTPPRNFGYSVTITREYDLETENQEEPPEPLDQPTNVYVKDY